jgi:hypothetical protein
MDKNDIKLIVAAITAAATAWAGASVTAPGNNTDKYLTRTEGEKLIDSYGPYVRDRQYIFTQTDANKIQLAGIQRDLVALRIQQARMEIKIDTLLKRRK